MPLMSKGEEKQAIEDRQRKTKHTFQNERGRKTWRKHWSIGGVLPSMPKGETIGNIVIDGKGPQRRQRGIRGSKVAERQRQQRSSRGSSDTRKKQR